MTDETAPGQCSEQAAVQQRSLLRQIAAPAMVLVVALVAWAVVLGHETPPPKVSDPPPLTVISGRQKERETLYRDQITPLLRIAEEANLESADRAILRIQEMFGQYRNGIEPFTEDITSWGTRFGVLVRMPGNWWYDDERIINYVGEKFEEHLFNEKQLKEDIVSVLGLLREDMQANQNRLLRDIRYAIEAKDMPELILPDYQEFGEQVRAVLVEFSGSRAEDSVYNGLAALLVGEVAAMTTTQIVTRILVTLGTSTATSVTTGGGATATGAAAGGAAGTTVGPVGTAIGVGVGIVVGAIVDWWMTERFRERMADDLGNYFDDLQSRVLDGVDGGEGLARTLVRFAEDWSWAQKSSVKTMIVGGP